MLSLHKYLQLTPVHAIVLSLSCRFLLFPSLSFSLYLPIYPVNCLGEWLLSIAAQIKDKYHVECALYSHFTCVWLNTWLLSVLCYRYRLLATWGDKGICTRSLAWLVERFLLLSVSFLKFWYRTKELLPLWFTPSINWSFSQTINQSVSQSVTAPVTCVGQKHFGLGLWTWLPPANQINRLTVSEWYTHT